MLTLNELSDLLVQSDTDFEIIGHERPILSTGDARQYFDITKAAPVFIIQTEKGLIALIVSSQQGRIDLNKIGELTGFSNFKMADKKKVLAITGYEVGSIPLIGHNLPCFLDLALLNSDYIYGGTGDMNHTLKIKPEDVVRLNKDTRIITL